MTVQAVRWAALTTATGALLGTVAMTSGCSSGAAPDDRPTQKYAGAAWELSFNVAINKTQESDPRRQRGVPLTGLTAIRFETNEAGLVTRSHARVMDEDGQIWEETLTSGSGRVTRNWHLCRLSATPPLEVSGADVVIGLAGPDEPPSSAQANADGTISWRYPDGVVDVRVTQTGNNRFARTLELFGSGTDSLLVTYSDYELRSITSDQVLAEQSEDAAFTAACPAID